MSGNTDDGNPRLNINCIICLQLADQALVTTCCIDLICNSCYQKISKNMCPKCRCKDFKVNEELYIRKFIQEVSPEIQFFVKPMTGGSIVIRLRELDTLEMLFQRVYEKTGIPVNQIRLVFQGKNLISSKKSLKSAKITANCDVHQLGRLKGGKQ